jgi:general secretion pathway protein D
MKAHCILLAALVSAALAQNEPAPPDPTRTSPKMKAALMAGGSAVPEMSVKGLVLSAERQGAIVMFEVAGGGRALARPAVPFNVVADGEARKLVIKRIDETGIEVEAPDHNESLVIGSFSIITNQRGGLPGEVDYAEFRDLPLLDALRMLSDQTSQNYSASVEANKIQVNAMLRNVSANSIVEEICKSHGLWFRRDATSGIMRIMTVAEFEKDLAGYREEQTEVFTLKYPNVSEIAIAISDLYGDRVQLSLGAEESDDDMRRDLEERFDRFDILTERTQTAGTLNGNIVGNNVNGFFSNGGRVNGFGGFSDSEGRPGSNSRFRSDNRRSQRDDRNTQVDEGTFRSLTPDQAQRVDRALREDGLNVEALRKRPATIFVTGSRRNNMVVVRTADISALDDIRRLVTRLDVQTPLVLMEVKVLSIELGKGFESAFEYQIVEGKFGASFTTGVINPSVTRDPITNAPTGVVPLPGVGSQGLRDGQFIFQYLGDTVRARLQLLASKNRVKTIATPTLLTANNEVSRIFLGEERPLIRGISSQTIITDNNVATTPTTQTEFRNVGNTLLITPNINSDRTVTLRLVQENSFISPNGANIPVVTTGDDDDDNNGILPGNGNNNNDRDNETGVRQVPIDVVGTRSVSGTFIAKDGMAVAIGGLIEEVDSDRREGVPFLGDIPGLGLLFRRQSTEKSRRELVIVLRPYVMSTATDSERITRDMLDRLAPSSVEKLVDEGFLPELPPVPPAKQQSRPPRSAAATKKTAPAPDPAIEGKKSAPLKKNQSLR